MISQSLSPNRPAFFKKLALSLPQQPGFKIGPAPVPSGKSRPGSRNMRKLASTDTLSTAQRSTRASRSSLLKSGIIRFRRFILLGIWILCGRAEAGSIIVTVRDREGALVSDAVVYAKSSDPVGSPEKKRAVIEQRDKQFVPYVTAIQVGTSVIFPNKDDVRHDVYSLSPAKEFELPLYAGTPAEPITFDKEGFVTLGCNIHDWMVAYVAVLPTPYFQVTGKDGRAMLKDLPAGQYSVEAWQPLLKGPPKKFAQHVDLVGESKELLFTLDLKPDFRTKRAPSLSIGEYR
jgi:plastocyanin